MSICFPVYVLLSPRFFVLFFSIRYSGSYSLLPVIYSTYVHIFFYYCTIITRFRICNDFQSHTVTFTSKMSIFDLIWILDRRNISATAPTTIFAANPLWFIMNSSAWFSAHLYILQYLFFIPILTRLTLFWFHYIINNFSTVIAN